MKPHDRHQALLSTIVALEWLTAPVPAYPSRYAAALHAANTAHLTIGGGDPGPRPVNEISDPTGQAAIRGTANPIATNMRDAAAIVVETAHAIHDDVHQAHYTQALPLRATGLAGALRSMTWVITVPHHAEAAVGILQRRSDYEGAAQLDTSIDLVASTAIALVAMARTSSAVVTRTEADTPKQRALEHCTSCARIMRADGTPYQVLIDERYRKPKLCRWCGDHRTAAGTRPDLRAVDAMLRHGKVSARLWAEIERERTA